MQQQQPSSSSNISGNAPVQYGNNVIYNAGVYPELIKDKKVTNWNCPVPVEVGSPIRNGDLIDIPLYWSHRLTADGKPASPMAVYIEKVNLRDGFQQRTITMKDGKTFPSSSMGVDVDPVARKEEHSFLKDFPAFGLQVIKKFCGPQGDLVKLDVKQEYVNTIEDFKNKFEFTPLIVEKVWDGKKKGEDSVMADAQQRRAGWKPPTFADSKASAPPAESKEKVFYSWYVNMPKNRNKFQLLNLEDDAPVYGGLESTIAQTPGIVVDLVVALPSIRLHLKKRTWSLQNEAVCAYLHRTMQKLTHMQVFRPGMGAMGRSLQAPILSGNGQQQEGLPGSNKKRKLADGPEGK
jgi:hypothetical protein